MGRADSPLRDRVIFVEGAPRSGTTWLVTLLATHPEIAGVEAESHLFDLGVDRLFDNFERRHPDVHGLDVYVERDELVDLVRDLCDGLLLAMREHVSAGTTAPFVVEKTPVAVGIGGRDLERKRECYPDAWYLHIVRDREAVARSLMRAPWQPDRSHAACSALWDEAVGSARTTLGDLPRYREVRYEGLRDDPAGTCRGLFAWLGVLAGERELETVRALSRESFSELGPLRQARGRRSAVVDASRGAASAARRRATRRRSRRRSGRELVAGFALALRDRDEATLRALSAPGLELVLRAPGGDRVARGDEGRAALLELAEAAFARRPVGEWWGPTGEGLAWSVFFSALHGDATRVDLVIGLLLAEGQEQVRRATVISAGPLSGRPVH